MLEESEFNTEASTGVEEPAKGEGDPANPEPQAGSPLQTGRGWDGRGLGVWNLGAQGRGSAGTLPSALWGWGAGGGGGCMPWCCQWELQVDRSWQVPLPPPASHLPPPRGPRWARAAHEEGMSAQRLSRVAGWEEVTAPPSAPHACCTSCRTASGARFSPEDATRLPAFPPRVGGNRTGALSPPPQIG